MFNRNGSSSFLTKLLHSPVCRRAHGIDKLIREIQQRLAGYECKSHIAVALLHYVECPKGRPRLAVTALLNSDGGAPVSCIQGKLTRGANVSNEMCAELGLVLFGVVPVSFTTNLSGLHIAADGVSNLDWV